MTFGGTGEIYFRKAHRNASKPIQQVLAHFSQKRRIHGKTDNSAKFIPTLTCTFELLIEVNFPYKIYKSTAGPGHLILSLGFLWWDTGISGEIMLDGEGVIRNLGTITTQKINHGRGRLKKVVYNEVFTAVLFVGGLQLMGFGHKVCFCFFGGQGGPSP